MWHCICGLKVIGSKCPGELNPAILGVNHFQCSDTQPDLLVVLETLRELKLGEWSMTDAEKLFMEYYNKGRVLVASIESESERILHIQRLERIAFEAKAHLQAAYDHERDLKAKLKVSQKDWLVTRPTTDVESNAINVVKARKARMSKMDKLAEQLEKAGIDEETRKVMLANLQAKMTEPNQKVVTFKTAQPKVVDTGRIVVEVNKPETNGNEEKKPFDWSSITKK